MYLRQITKNGITRLYLYETYYEDKKTKSRCVEPLGRLDELQKQFDDPVAHFKQVALQRTEEQKQETTMMISIDTAEVLENGEDNLKNAGYGMLKYLYRDLELDKFWNWKSRNGNYQYSPDQIFRLLVLARCLFPASKKKTFENREIFFEGFDGFSLDDVYRALDVFSEHGQALQKWIYEHSHDICQRDLSVSYFDCTNYYFDIGCPDVDLLDEEGNIVDKDGALCAAKYRKRGPEKNRRPDPIIGMGLLMDKNGIPISYDLFPGNESEKVHFRPVINRIKTEFTDTRIIFVADRGLNTSDNIYFLNGDNRGEINERDGYVYGQSIRGADKEFKEWVLKESEYMISKVTSDGGEEIFFKHKSRIHPKQIQVNLTVPGQKKKKKKNVIIDQKQMVYYSEKYAKKQKKNRDIMIERAKDLIAHPKKYDKVTSAGSAAYISGISFDKTTGEIVDGRVLSLDEEKIKEEEKYDGYYSIVTSDLEMSDLKMREVYSGLAKIEETFKISKSEFESRPVYVWTNEHIEGHFATCFTALVLIRLLQAKLGNKYPVGQILESLRKYNCTKIDVNTHQFLYYDDVLEACEKAFDVQLNKKYLSQQQVRRLLRY